MERETSQLYAENGKYEEMLAQYNTSLNDEEVKTAVAKLIAEKVPQNDTLEVKKHSSTAST